MNNRDHQWVKSCISVVTDWNGVGKLEWNMQGCAGYINDTVLDFTLQHILEIKSNMKISTIEASNVEFSKCKIDNLQFGKILQLLIDNNIPTQRLKFFQNDISDARPLFSYLKTAVGKALREVHLSHNKLDDNMCMNLLRTCTETVPKPIYLRLEKNLCSNPEQVVRNLDSKISRVNKPGGENCPHGVLVQLHNTFFTSQQEGDRSSRQYPPNPQYSSHQYQNTQTTSSYSSYTTQQQAYAQHQAYGPGNHVSNFSPAPGMTRPTREQPVMMASSDIRPLYPPAVSSSADPKTRRRRRSKTRSPPRSPSPIRKRRSITPTRESRETTGQKCSKCDFVCTGILKNYCCRLCKIEGIHGPQCKKIMFSSLTQLHPSVKRIPVPPSKKVEVETVEVEDDDDEINDDFAKRIAPATAKSSSAKKSKLPPMTAEELFFADTDFEREHPEWSFKWLKELESKSRDAPLPVPESVVCYFYNVNTGAISDIQPIDEEAEKSLLLLVEEDFTHEEFAKFNIRPPPAKMSISAS